DHYNPADPAAAAAAAAVATQGYPIYTSEAYERQQQQPSNPAPFNPALYSQSQQSPAPGLTFSSSSPSLSNCSSPSYQNPSNLHMAPTMEQVSSTHSQPAYTHPHPSPYYMETPQTAVYYSMGQSAPNAMAGPNSFLPALNLMSSAGAPMATPTVDPNGYPMTSAPHFPQGIPSYYADKPYNGMDEHTAALHHGYSQLSGRFDDPTHLAMTRTYSRTDGSPLSADPSVTMSNYFNRFPSAKRSRPTTTKNKRYVCQICQSAFARPSTLNTHMNKHTGAKPHMCPHPGCGKRFSVLSNMRRHRKIHDRNQAQAQAQAQIHTPTQLPSGTPPAVMHQTVQPQMQKVI
ncbi:hypothetical protein IWQ62_006693, partial [Dispira parvispora]